MAKFWRGGGSKKRPTEKAGRCWYVGAVTAGRRADGWPVPVRG